MVMGAGALGSVCRWCNTDFRTRLWLIVRVQKHLRCVQGMHNYGMPTATAEAMASRAKEDHALAAAHRLEGQSIFHAALAPTRLAEPV